MKNRLMLGCLAVVLSLSLAAPLSAQRADRAIITGVVMDPTGALIPGASVSILDEGTGVATDLESNAAGAFNSPSLVLGVLHRPGRERRLQDIPAVPESLLTGGQIFRQDAILELGDVD